MSLRLLSVFSTQCFNSFDRAANNFNVFPCKVNYFWTAIIEVHFLLRRVLASDIVHSLGMYAF